MQHKFSFAQVDVFSAVPYKGNPLAVVHDADALTDTQMAAFANWTNLSETAFLLQPTDSAADYRVRIFTPSEEFAFAGHPTLGACHAWLAAGGRPKGAEIVQQCEIGLIRIRRHDRLTFAAPPATPEEIDEATRAKVAASLRVDPAVILATQRVAKTPGWIAALFASREEVLALQPDFAAMGDLKIGAVAPTAKGEADFEVRGFVPGIGEDPVTGSLNAGLARWLIGTGRAPARYTAAQGTAIGRAGRIYLEQEGANIWVGGDCVTCITGDVVI
jgi:PhzF family phenazine biosynthesis protein